MSPADAAAAAARGDVEPGYDPHDGFFTADQSQTMVKRVDRELAADDDLGIEP